MKKLILMLMLLAPMTMFAQAKFGHIDSQAFLESLPEAMAVQKALQAKGDEYQKNLKAMQDELERKAKDYDAQKGYYEHHKAGGDREAAAGYVRQDSADRSGQPEGFQR